LPPLGFNAITAAIPFMKTFSWLSLFAFILTLAVAATAGELQVHIKARFFEVPKEVLATLQNISHVSDRTTEILTAGETATLLQELNTNYTVAHLAEPEVVSTSGRQTQMRATILQTVITNSTLQEVSTSTGKTNSIVFESEEMEFGPVLNVIPFISSNGQKIELSTTASDTKFFGYADPGNSPSRFATNSVGQKVNLPIILPVLQGNKASAKITVPDGQTLVLFLKADPQQDKYPQFIKEQALAQTEKKNGGELLVALITPTIVDPAGNRIHPDD
jgi:hypothetical protein